MTPLSINLNQPLSNWISNSESKFKIFSFIHPVALDLKSKTQLKSLSSTYLGHTFQPVVLPITVNFDANAIVLPPAKSKSIYLVHGRRISPQPAIDSIMPLAKSKSRLRSLSPYYLGRISSKPDVLPAVAGFDGEPSIKPVDPDPPVTSFDAQPVVLPIAGFDDCHVFHLSLHNNLMLKTQLCLKGHTNNNNHSLISKTTGQNLWKEYPNLHRHSFCFVGHGTYLLAGCCDNLVLVCFYDNLDEGRGHGHPREALWNLTTNQLKFLPPADQHRTITNTYVCSYGFGFDPVSQDYKVVKSLLFDYDGGSSSFGSGFSELYSLKTDSWKKTTSSPAGNVGLVSNPSIHINGCYYWNAYFKHAKSVTDCYEEIILSFNFANEKFSYIPKPSCKVKMGLTSDYFLVEFHNSLAALVFWTPTPKSRFTFGITLENSFTFEILVWDGESWTSRVPALHVPARVYSFAGLFENDKLFFINTEHNLLLFDCATRELENLGLHADPKRLWLPYYDDCYKDY